MFKSTSNLSHDERVWIKKIGFVDDAIKANACAVLLNDVEESTNSIYLGIESAFATFWTE